VNHQHLIYSGGNDIYRIANEEVIMMDIDKEIIVREYPISLVSMLGGSRAKLLWM
jgi:hypothetical protein